MKRTTVLLVALATAVSGCTQSLNNYRADTFVGYAPQAIPQEGGVERTWNDLQKDANSAKDRNAGKPGECLMVYLNNGKVIGTFEGWPESRTVPVIKDRVISEWIITTNVTEEAAGKNESKSRTVTWNTTTATSKDTKTVGGRMSEARKLNFNDVVIYRDVWNGGPVTMKVALTEADGDEKAKQEKLIDEALNHIDPTKEGASKLVRELTSGNPFSGAIVTTPTGLAIAAGLDAVKLTVNLFNELHKENDVLIDQAQGFIPASVNTNNAMRLKAGFYIFARNTIDNKEIISSDAKVIEFDPINGVFRLQDNTQEPRTWLSFRVTAEPKERCM